MTPSVVTRPPSPRTTKFNKDASRARSLVVGKLKATLLNMVSVTYTLPTLSPSYSQSLVRAFIYIFSNAHERAIPPLVCHSPASCRWTFRLSSWNLMWLSLLVLLSLWPHRHVQLAFISCPNATLPFYCPSRHSWSLGHTTCDLSWLL